jgi:tetratricopeptide (TPR) repeat protein
LAQACRDLGYVLCKTHRSAAAVPVLRRAVGLLTSPAADSPPGPNDRCLLADVYLALDIALRPDQAAAEKATRASRDLIDRLAAESPTNLTYRTRQVTAYLTLSRQMTAGQRYREAEASIQHALDLLGRPAARWDTRPSTAAAKFEHARLLEATNRPGEAESAYRLGVELLEPCVRETPLEASRWSSLLYSYEHLAQLLERAGRSDAATAERRRALDSLGHFLDGLPQEDAYQDLALNVFTEFTGALRLSGERPEHEPLYRGALAAAERLAGKFPNGPRPRSVAAFWHASLGSVLTARGQLDEAAGEYRRALAGYQTVLDLDPKRAPTINNVAWMLATCPDERLRDPARAVELAKRATELAPQYGYLWNTRGVAHYRAGDLDAARAALETSIARYAGQSDASRLESFSTFFLAMAHARLGNSAEARRWYDRAVRWMEQYQPGDLELRRFRAEAEQLLNQKKHSEKNGR